MTLTPQRNGFCKRARLMALCVLGFSALGGNLHSARVPLSVTEPGGVARHPGFVTSGVPFPMGALRTNAEVRLLNEQGAELPLQLQTTATWRDGSVKWLLLDFPVELEAHRAREFYLEYGPGMARRPVSPGIRSEANAQGVVLNTGPLRLSILRTNLESLIQSFDYDLNGDGRFEPDEQVASGLAASMTLAPRSHATLGPLPPDEIIVEEPGPLRAVVRVGGWFSADTGSKPWMRYLLRVHAFAGASNLRLQFTATNLDPNRPQALVERYGIELRLSASAPTNSPIEGWAGGGKQPHHFELSGPASTARMWQSSEGAYEFSGPNAQAKGVRAPGWVGWQNQRRRALLAVRHFWQQFPAELSVGPEMLGANFYRAAGDKPFDWDQGLAKTHEVWLEFGPNAVADTVRLLTDPQNDLFAIAPARWYCDSKVFGELSPFDFDRFPDYETLTEASGDQYIKRMATGFRHWGDFYYGGEYKGTNAYMDLEYDVHHNFYCQFARTGLRKYLDAAIPMATHQADIDTNHKTGWQWKHSPRHVETRAEFGHTFTRGLLETYYLTGDRRCLETALELGNYFAKAIRIPRELGNERQIGWSLISLLPVYEATWDKTYFEAAKSAVDRLLAGLEEKGKFNIRWDNRISFFNGIAATGFIYYHRATGDERVANAALKVLRRTQGFYPEYAGRTLEALAWAFERTQAPEYLDLLQRTWETTMARQISWNVMELGAPTIFTAHALPLIAESGFLPRAATPLQLTPAQFATENGMYAHHLPGGEAELYLRNDSNEPWDLVVIRKGAWKGSGSAVLYDAAGTKIETLAYPKAGVIWQRQVVHVQPRLQGAYRLAMRSRSASNVKGGSYITWDVATSRSMPAVISMPAYQGLQFVTPYLYTQPTSDSSKIELQLAGEGEGFKKAVLWDPDGNVAGSSEAFIDLGDTGRYYYKISANVPPKQMTGLWRISLQDVSLVKLDGLLPYFSTSPESFFRPDRPDPTTDYGACRR